MELQEEPTRADTSSRLSPAALFHGSVGMRHSIGHTIRPGCRRSIRAGAARGGLQATYGRVYTAASELARVGIRARGAEEGVEAVGFAYP